MIPKNKIVSLRGIQFNSEKIKAQGKKSFIINFFDHPVYLRIQKLEERKKILDDDYDTIIQNVPEIVVIERKKPRAKRAKKGCSNC